jgi:ABC-type Fe3+ transport system substrate-binding protein
MDKIIDIKKSLYDIATSSKEAKDLLVSYEVIPRDDDSMLSTLGKQLSLEMALKSKKLNVDAFVKQLNELIQENHNRVDTTMIEPQKSRNASIKIEGVLPCPVRLPLLEGFEAWLETQPNDYKDKIGYELKAASMGVDWLTDSIREAQDDSVLADVFLSAGFDLFFDQHLIGKFKKQGVFKDFMQHESYNTDFNNENIQLKDPDSEYSMVGVVPAVFLVNTDVLDGRDMPTSWEDILKPEFEDSVSLPVGDFDLHNAILLNIYKKYGKDGLKKLGRSFMRSLSPAEMVNSHRKRQQPTVTIMPYFFTKMTRGKGPMQAVWPADGAIISPIFMLTKASKQADVQPIVDFFSSKEVGEILSHNGRFPSVHPDVDNFVDKKNPYMWLGWDYINTHSIGELIKESMQIFDEASKGKKR